MLYNTLRQSISVLIIMLLSLAIQGQSIIKGYVLESKNNEPIPFANIIIEEEQILVNSDDDGYFEIVNIAPGQYNIKISSIGYNTENLFAIQTYINKPVELRIELRESSVLLDEATVTSTRSITSEKVSSIQQVGFSEIIRTPGGNRDVSKTLQILPGVASIDGFRNDIIVRGGASFENSFFLDGIKVPSINHFTTQGTGGGVWGLINADAISSVDLYMGDFPIDKGDALSGVFDISLKKGSDEKLNGNVVFGSSDLGVSLNGPIGKKTNYLLSARQAYLSGVFRLFDFAFLPTYRDFLLKVDHRFNQKNHLTFLAIAGDDEVSINTDAKIDDSTQGEQNRVFLSFAPEFRQRTYTVGATYKRFYDSGYLTVTSSRSFLRNAQDKYRDNDDSDPTKLRLDYDSDEVENHLRITNKYIKGNTAWVTGAEMVHTDFETKSFRLQSDPQGVVTPIINNTTLDFIQYSIYNNVNLKFADERLKVDVGVRATMSDYGDETDNFADQLSMRLATSYTVSDRVSIFGNMGRYFQLPPSTLLAFRGADGNLANSARIKYIKSDQATLGFDYKTENGFSMKLAGFYKLYDDYPFLLTDSISFTNIGVVNFGAIGDEPANSTAEGRAYGVEVSARQRLRNGFYGLLTYTYAKSEFKDRFGVYKSTAWDYEHVANLTVGKKLPNNWEIGIKFRLAGGTPWTPYDVPTSSLIEVWDAEGAGIADYSRLNDNRTEIVHQMDVRIDKRYYFSKYSLNFYFDIQNVYNNQTGFPPFLITEQNQDGSNRINAQDPSRYNLKESDNVQPPFFPALGAILEF